MDRTTIIEAPGEAMNLPTNAALAPPFRWSAIFSGAFIAIGIALVLGTLGFAIAVSALEAESPTIEGGMAVGLGIWLLVVPLIALFFGGWAAARGSRFSRMSGALHGAVVWAVYQVANLVFVGALLAGVITGIAGLAGPQMQIGNQLLTGLIGAGTGALWGIFGSMVLSALLAILGGLFGTGGRAKREVRQTVMVGRTAESRA